MERGCGFRQSLGWVLDRQYSAFAFLHFAFSSSFLAEALTPLDTPTPVFPRTPLAQPSPAVFVCPRIHPELNHPTKGRG
jgi:hypothetical protein